MHVMAGFKGQNNVDSYNSTFQQVSYDLVARNEIVISLI